MKVLTPAALTPPAGLSAYSALPSRHSDPNHAVRPMVALSVVAAPSVVRGFATIQQARHGFTPKSDSCSYRLAVRLRLLPTLPRGRRSCLQLHSYDTLWRGLTPRRQSVLTDALDGRDKPGHDAEAAAREFAGYRMNRKKSRESARRIPQPTDRLLRGGGSAPPLPSGRSPPRRGGEEAIVSGFGFPPVAKQAKGWRRLSRLTRVF